MLITLNYGLILSIPLLYHNEYFYCYKLEIVIKEKWQRPHILMEHLVLQLQIS